MTDNNSSNLNDYKLVSDIPDVSNNDIVLELKTGIYNLFLSLYKSQIPYVGPDLAMAYSIDFLEEIVINFKTTLQNQER